MTTNNRDKVIADSGWGIKPDDQPANADEAAPDAKCDTYQYDPADDDGVRKILLAQRRAFNTANKVIIGGGQTRIVDINRDVFVIEGLTFGDPHLIEVLNALGASFNPQNMAKLGTDFDGTREYALGRVSAWGAERSG